MPRAASSSYVATCYLFLIVGTVDARRFALSENSFPYLALSPTSTTTSVLEWSSPRMLHAFFMADCIEVAPRGIRAVYTQPSSSSFSGQPLLRGGEIIINSRCVATPDALCAITEEEVPVFPCSNRTRIAFPYQPPDAYNNNNDEPDQVLRAFAASSCTQHGAERVLTPRLASRYIPTACDIIEGEWVVHYHPASDVLMLHRQTFAPPAYCVVLLLALACLYFATEEEGGMTRTGQLVPMVLVCCCAIPTIPFVAFCGQVHFGAACLMTLLYREGANLFALIAFADAVYRTPENPYASLFCAVLSVQLCRQWLLRHPPLLGHAVMLCLTAEFGVKPQLPDLLWPIVGGTGFMASLALAHVMQLKPNGGESKR